jgi:inner membrane protein
MDSLTQLTFGAAVGEAVLGPKVGRKALLWGGVLGTLPDLDVFIPLDGPVERFVYHRGFTHSVFVLALAAPLLAWAISRIHSAKHEHFKGWWLLTFLVLQGSVVLDFLTVYGTQLLWPFGGAPLAWPVFFIIDPLFTLPLLAGCLAALVARGGAGHRWNAIGLAVALVYMAWAICARELVVHQARDKLAGQDVEYSRLLATPTPFNTLLWRVVGLNGDGYFETYLSIFDGEAPLELTRHPRRTELLDGLERHPPVEQLRWFTRGWYAVDDEAGEIVMTDLRMGSEPDYVFRFKVAERGSPRPLPVEGEKLPTETSWNRLRWIRERIWRPMPPPG